MKYVVLIILALISISTIKSFRKESKIINEKYGDSINRFDSFFLSYMLIIIEIFALLLYLNLPFWSFILYLIMIMVSYASFSTVIITDEHFVKRTIGEELTIPWSEVVELRVVRKKNSHIKFVKRDGYKKVELSGLMLGSIIDAIKPIAIANRFQIDKSWLIDINYDS